MIDSEQHGTPERWTFAGIRLGTRNQAVYEWLPEGTTETVVFGKIGRTAILGLVYTIRVERYPDGRMTVWGHPEWTGDRYGNTEQIRDWRVEEIAAERRLAEQKAIRAAKNADPLDEILQPLLRRAAKLRTRADRDAFAAYVLRRIHDAY